MSLNTTSDQLEDRCRDALVESSLQKVREKAEMTHLAMQRRHANIQKRSSKLLTECMLTLILLDSLAGKGSSKHRAKLRQTISEDRKKLKNLTAQYNSALESMQCQLPRASEEDILAGKFPWLELVGMCCYMYGCVPLSHTLIATITLERPS